VSAQAIDQHGALAHQQFPRAMQDQHALLLFALHRHEAHVRPCHRLADRLGIGRVVLAALEVGLDVARRHQPDLMAKRSQFPGPMVRGRAGLDADQAWRKVSEELQQLRPPQLLSNDDRADGGDAVDLKDSLGDIQTDRGNLHSGRLLSLWRSATTTLWHFDAGEQGPSTPSSSSAMARHFGIHYGLQNRPVLRLTKSSCRVECIVTVSNLSLEVLAMKDTELGTSGSRPGWRLLRAGLAPLIAIALDRVLTAGQVANLV
jgi:hypothetical protein